MSSGDPGPSTSSERRLIGEVIADTVPVGIVVIDAAGHITWCNAELLHQFRYGAQELIGQPIEILLPQRFRGHHAALRSGYHDAPTARAMGMGRELFGRRKDGAQFPVEIGLRPLASESDPQVVATVVDISGRRQAETMFHRVIASAPCGMMVIDPARHILLANDHLLRLFGYTRGELIGRPFDVLVPQRYRGRHAEHVASYAKDAIPRSMGSGLDLTGQHKSGREFQVEIGLSPVQMELGACVLATVIDVTASRMAEHKLRTAHAALEEFAYVVSHDLRSPLRGLADLAEWIEQDLGDDMPDAVRHHVVRMRERTERLEDLIDNLLKYAKSGSDHTAAESVDVEAWLRSCVDFVSAPANVTVIVHSQIEQATLPTTPLGTVMRNLIANAVTHNGKAEPRIEVSARNQGPHAIFEVSDNGPGIPAASRQRVFQLFQRLSRDKPGNGMGLALAKRIVNAHGGTIDIVDPPGGGTGAVFVVKWPLMLGLPRDD